jgi:hypothetical protein
MFSTEPVLVSATPARPGTPQAPPLSQGREPGGLLIAWANRPPISK